MNGPSDANGIAVRPARRQDAAAIATLANELNIGLGQRAVCSPELVDRYGFGPKPLFEILVAEAAGEIVGYALFEECFTTDLFAPSVYLHDIMVGPKVRRSGLGRRIMAEVARAAIDRGATSVYWSVLTSNRRARRFYAGLGARDENVRALVLDGAALANMATEVRPAQAPAAPGSR